MPILRLTAGLSLPELIISLAISNILLIGLLASFILGQKNYRKFIAEELLFQQARQVEIVFSEALQHAGYLGCRNLDNLSLTLDFSTNSFYNIGQSLEGFTAKKFNLPPYFKLRSIKKDSDILIVRYLSPENVLLKTALNNNSPIITQKDIKLTINHLALISDCESADAFIINSTEKNNFQHPEFTHLYSTNSRLGSLITQIFFIQATQQFYLKNHPIYGLYEEDINGNRQLLVAGINQLKIQYADNDNLFKPAEQIIYWQAVKKIKVSVISQAFFEHKIIRETFTYVFKLRNH